MPSTSISTSLDTGNSLLTLTQLKNYFGSTSTTFDNRFYDLINVVSYRFNLETDRKLKARNITEYHDGDDKNFVQLNEYPINSNSTSISIYIDRDRQYGTTSKISSTRIVIYSTQGKVFLRDRHFDNGEVSTKVVYNAGYSSIPFDLQYAAKEMIRLLWNREKNNRIGIRSESYDGGSISYEGDMPWSVQKVLEKYKRRNSY